MNWGALLDQVGIPLGSVVVGWIAQKFSNKRQRAKAVAVGEQFARYATAAANMTVIAARAGHVPMKAAELVGAWRVRFVALAKAAGHNPTKEVIARATGKAVRGLIDQLSEFGDDGKPIAVVAALEAALLATDFGRDL
mgnify:FL=1